MNSIDKDNRLRRIKNVKFLASFIIQFIALMLVVTMVFMFIVGHSFKN